MNEIKTEENMSFEIASQLNLCLMLSKHHILLLITLTLLIAAEYKEEETRHKNTNFLNMCLFFMFSTI